jgi:multidrug efflux pump subunit AcrA (membrane-fusion protein)
MAAAFVAGAGLLYSMQYAALKRGERLGYAEAQAAHQAALEAAQAAVDAVSEEQRRAAAELAAARQAIQDHLEVLQDAAFEDGNPMCVLPPGSILRLNSIAGFGREDPGAGR